VNLGPLHGIPYGLKDLFDTKGIVTGWGAEPFRDRVPDADATIVTRLRAAGAVLLGKTTVGALAYNDIWYGGVTRNPWNLNEGSSGSSAGSASRPRRRGCAPLPSGRKRWARSPRPASAAARRACAHLRPGQPGGGHGAVQQPRQGRPDLPVGRGYGIVLAVLNGGDPADRGSIDAPFVFDAAPGIAGMRLRLPARGLRRRRHAGGPRRAGGRAGLGIEVCRGHLPDLPYGALMNILYAEAAASFEDLTLSEPRRHADLAGRRRLAEHDAQGALPVGGGSCATGPPALSRDAGAGRAVPPVDALIGPFMTGPMLIASNYTGHPCLHLRAGFEDLGTRSPASLGSGKLTTGEADAAGRTFRVPQGISLWGRLFDEGPILNLGMALEAALGVAAAAPPFHPDPADTRSPTPQRVIKTARSRAQHGDHDETQGFPSVHRPVRRHACCSAR
jgi:hypothetical protein